MRPARLLAVARRDLVTATRGRRGVGLLFAVLLVPLAATPYGDEGLAPPPPPVVVSGDVPPEVAALPDVRTGANAVVFYRDGDGRLHARGGFLPDRLRRALDADDPAAVRLENVFPAFRIPQRTLFIALVAASILVGAVAESLPGERSARTFETMLTAAISRGELVVGKWLAWAFVGAATTGGAALLAVLLGHVAPGWWALPMPLVPASTIAVGLWVVRRSSDVVGGSTVAIRVVPALLGGAGVVAWYVGTFYDPLLGAAVPVGGALLACGVAWDGAGPPLVATAVTGGTTAALLAWTTRDLTADPIGRETLPGPVRLALAITTSAAAAHLLCTVAPMLWGFAGNPRFAAELPARPGLLASSLLLLLVAGTRAASAADAADAVLLRVPRAVDVVPIVLVGVAAALSAPLSEVLAPASPELADARERMARALVPDDPLVLVLAVLGQELVVRGAIARLVPPWAVALAGAAVLAPFDPLRGLALGALFAGLVAVTRSSLAAIAAHLVWAALAGVASTPAVAAAAVGTTLALLTLAPRAR